MPHTTAGRPRTKQQFVHQTLRDRIMRCELLPGERLVIDLLARQLRVSTIPVREALQMLQSEGLIVNVPHVGATVAPISRESVIDVFTVLEGLGMVAARLVAERAAPADLHVLEEQVHAMDVAVAARRYEDWASLNTRFHLALGALPGLPMLNEMTERVMDNWHRVRSYFFKGVLLHRVEQAQREHRELVAAMIAGDLEQVDGLIREHNRGALRAYLSYLDATAPPDGHGAAREVNATSESRRELSR